MTGFTLPGMIELPGCVAGKLDFADAAARTAPEPANVVCDLEQTDRDRFQVSRSLQRLRPFRLVLQSGFLPREKRCRCVAPDAASFFLED